MCSFHGSPLCFATYSSTTNPCILIFAVEITIIVLCSVRLQSDDGWPSDAKGADIPREKNYSYLRLLRFADAFNFRRISTFALMLAILRGVLMWPLSYLGVDSRRFWLAVFVQLVMLGLLSALAASLACTCLLIALS